MRKRKPDLKLSATTPSETKEARFIRHGETLDSFLLRHYKHAGYTSPNDYIVGLIRNEMQRVESLAVAT